jgi:3-methyladenine DNA glycosylase/8-oxoguanine DNA glycosylase
MAPSGSPATPDARRSWQPPYAVDLVAVLGPFMRGRGDPASMVAADGAVWRACSTPDGPGTLRLSTAGEEVDAQAWGPGADWLLGAVPDLLGGDDDSTGFPAENLPEVLRAPWRRLGPRWRVPRSRLVLEALLVAILEQKVTGVQSRRAWRSLLSDVGEPAPGPTPRPMQVLTDPVRLRRVPSWQWHRWGVGPQQSATIMRALQSPGRIEECADLPLADAHRRLASLPGIGGWTVAEVCQRALGDADAVSFGDYHLAHHVGYAFTGSMDGTDAQMAELLAPFAGHRYRVQRLVEVAGVTRPARGPRMTIADHRAR